MLPYFRLLTSQAGPVVEMEGRETIMLGSNNYLGLTGDARVKRAAADALETYGTALTGSRLLNGTIPLHVELETRARRVDGDRVGARLHHRLPGERRLHRHDPRTRRHGDLRLRRPRLDPRRLPAVRREAAPLPPQPLDKLEKMLERSAADGGGVLVVVDGVFSMEGDICDLPPVVELCKRYGARLMVDEAHGAGAIGARGAGASELFGLESEVDLRMGTFSKSFASCGGFIAGPAEVIEYLRIAARSFLFSAAAVPAAVGAALQSLRILRSAEGPELLARLADNAAYLHNGLTEIGLRVVEPTKMPDGQRGADPDRAGDRRRRHARGRSLEGALRRRRLHQRRDSPGGAAVAAPCCGRA